MSDFPTADEILKLYRKYRRQRNAWAKLIGRPIPNQPDPGELDAEDPENG